MALRKGFKESSGEFIVSAMPLIKFKKFEDLDK